MNPLLQLLEHGQSYWLDNLTRRMLRNGELERRVRQEGLRGVTSNPAIFAKAISGGGEYDDQIAALAREGRDVEGIYEGVVVTDIRDACDVLRPVYDESGGADGFVSLEVSPYLAHDTEGSIEEARRLYAAVDRPNVLIKIPGTPEGVPAVERLLYEGVNVNITLLFSIGAYEAVARSYLRALERRAEEGKPLDDVASVASFFLSRIDVLVDPFLGHYVRPGRTGDGPRPERLLGQAAVSNAKRAYARFLDLFSGERWAALEAGGARPQRMLWASTSTKDPLYSDVRYVEPLIGPHTVNTLPERTIAAFADHGHATPTVEVGMEEAEETLDALAEVGIDFDHVTEQLMHEGVQKFVDPYDRLMAVLARRRRELLGTETATVRVGGEAGPDGLDDLLESLRQRQFGRRVLAGDASPWARTPDREGPIRDRLGWLAGGETFRSQADDVTELADELEGEGVRDVVLLGMGGSVQAARALSEILGPADEGAPRLTVLDDTHPDAVRAVDEAIDPATALFVVASKSGTTVETLSLYRYFLERTREAVGDDAPRRFVAITDPGTPLAEEAGEVGFRRSLPAPADVGGRYSALTVFGLAPLVLTGVDVEPILESAATLRTDCDPAVPPAALPGVPLGAALGLAARAGRDKVTLLADDALEPLRPWLEQLLGESLGKEGTGVVPVAGEEPAPPSAYGIDRLFVRLSLEGADETGSSGLEETLDELEAAGHPVIRIDLPSRRHVGGELHRWMVATATAGAVLGVNPFDEPDVASVKTETARLLDRWREEGRLPEEDPIESRDGLHLYGEPERAPAAPDAPGAGDVLTSLVDGVEEGDYFALLAYFPASEERAEALEALRRTLWGRTGAAATVEHGPRYLHSTGQLHKGGPPTGVALLLTADPDRDLAIPGEDHGFGTLHRAQALADQRILERRGRRVLRIHLDDVDEGLRRLHDRLQPREALARA